MQAEVMTSFTRPTVALADHDFLRATYEVLVRALVPNQAAIDAVFEGLDASHSRLRVAHFQEREPGFLN